MTKVVSVLKGLHKVRMRLASGKFVVYCYAWRGGPRLNDQDGNPLPPDDPRILQAYNEARAAIRRPSPGTLFSLIAEFRASSDMPKADSSLRAYRSYLRMIEERWGTLPLAAVEDPQARGVFKGWRDEMAATPRKADYAWTVLARVLSFGVDRGRLKTNVCARGGRLYGVDHTSKVWTAGHIERFAAVASPDLRLALVLALWTGQRQGDLLRLSWSDYDQVAIRVRQAKTGTMIAIPVGETLRKVLGTPTGKSGAILRNSRGEPWTSDGFRTSWGKACRKAGISDVTFHDLRGSAVVRLARAGCTVPEIASLTGHSMRDAEGILQAHYLGRDSTLAKSAMRKREEYEA